MAGTGQFYTPVQVEVETDIGADVVDDGVAATFPPPTGLTIVGFDDVAGVMRVPRVDAAGRLIVVTAGAAPAVVEIEDAGAGTERGSVKADGAAIPASPDQGGFLISGRDDAGPSQLHLRCNAAGHLIVSQGTSTPGATITTPANTAVGIGATVPLPVPPAGTSRMTVQNVGGAGTFVRIRELAGVAGTGVLLPRFGSVSYGGEDGAIASLEAEEVIAAIATTVQIQFEGP